MGVDARPWQSAQPGDVWALTVHGLPPMPYRPIDAPVSGRAFIPVDGHSQTGIAANSRHITAGERLWPKEHS